MCRQAALLDTQTPPSGSKVLAGKPEDVPQSPQAAGVSLGSLEECQCLPTKQV